MTTLSPAVCAAAAASAVSGNSLTAAPSASGRGGFVVVGGERQAVLAGERGDSTAAVPHRAGIGREPAQPVVEGLVVGAGPGPHRDPPGPGFADCPRPGVWSIAETRLMACGNRSSRPSEQVFPVPACRAITAPLPAGARHAGRW
ncbi:hypothetical protein [Kibdelosporangium phytohabitans]|uniref:hypothetical protein n=1 Tax=Kibdelosporangium phytohabitans TaxID=860235 RepID=UPI0012FAFA1D|nr:hypothetical protein [Kibdelosporangium phytohabitans]MBE1463440.1 hypothetical protein [Kibdelosporangium phytohabitans]